MKEIFRFENYLNLIDQEETGKKLIEIYVTKGHHL